MFRIVPYNDSHRPEINRLIEASPGKARIWHWQFQENPFGYPFDPVVLMEGDRTAGFNGAVLVDACYNNERKRVMWSCDFYVDREFRGKGLGRMITDTQHEKADIIMAFGIRNMAAPVLLKMGWRSSDEVYVFRKYRTVRSFQQSLACLVQTFNRLRGTVGRTGHDLACELCDTLPAASSVDLLWERAALGYRKIVVRNHAYLHWRFERHPLASYRFIHVSDGDGLRAIGVLRQGMHTVHLVDMLACADDRSARNAIVSTMLDGYPGSASFTCTASDPLLSSCLRNYGFFRARMQPRFFVRSATGTDTDCEQGWFIMAGDSDGDLLAAARGA